MIDTTKEGQRDELHRSIWAIAEELRGTVDGWDFKNYVLGTMFYRYLSENLTNFVNSRQHSAENRYFDYAALSDEDAEQMREDLVAQKGFFLLPGELFTRVAEQASCNAHLSETLQSVFCHIEQSAKGSASEGSFTGLFDDFDLTGNKLGPTEAKRNEKLRRLLKGVADMELGEVKAHEIDAFGDAYEYLMTMYASHAGKSGGEFFTPSDVSQLLTRLGTIGKTEISSVYDPACGSGSLLLQAQKVLGRDAVRQGFYGQEVNVTTYNLCRINMFLHDVGIGRFHIACDDTLTNPKHWDQAPFELIVSNPPYSIKWAGNEDPQLLQDPRFAPAGVLAPKSKADLAFVMHCLSCLAENGTAAIVCFPGILYRGGAEQKIRKYLIDNNFVDAVIQLPGNLFFGTGIATCIMVLKKNKKDRRTLFADASGAYIKGTNTNQLTQKNINDIVRIYAERAEKAHSSRLASDAEIAAQEYNLSVGVYVEPDFREEEIDIGQLNGEIAELVEREQELRSRIDTFTAQMEKQSEQYSSYNDPI